MSQNINQLLEIARVIKTETKEEANSSIRIGSAFEEVIKYIRDNIGTGGVVITPTGGSFDENGHLILQMSNGSTLDCGDVGFIPKSTYISYLNTTTDNPKKSESEWIESLKGKNGNDGLNAYFKKKTILMFKGYPDEMPDNCHFCDGTDVPGYGPVADLRGLFVVGLDPRTPAEPKNADDTTENYGAIGNTGGKKSVSLAISELPKFFLRLFVNARPGKNDNLSDAPDKGVAWSTYRQNGNQDLDNKWVEGEATLGKTNTIGGDAEHENRGPYYTIAFMEVVREDEGSGGADTMQKTIYDSTNTGVVDNSEKLGGLTKEQIISAAIEAMSNDFVQKNGTDRLITLQEAEKIHAPGSDAETVDSLGSLIESTDEKEALVDEDSVVIMNSETGKLSRHLFSSLIEFLSAQSSNGKSAYQIALDNGFVGTQAQWLASLQGEPGTTLTADQLQILNTVPLICSDEKTDLTASTDVPVIRFVFQTAQSFTKIVGELNTAAAGGTFTVVAKKNGASFLSTNLTFDSGENTTRTASVPFVFTTPTISFAIGDYVEIFIITAGSLTNGKGLKIYLM